MKIPTRYNLIYTPAINEIPTRNVQHTILHTHYYLKIPTRNTQYSTFGVRQLCIHSLLLKYALLQYRVGKVVDSKWVFLVIPSG